MHDKSVLRQLITVGDRIVTNALAPEGRETREILDEAEKEVLAINERNARTQRGFQPLVTLVRDVSARVIELYNTKSTSEVTGVSSGYPNLDHVTAGLQRGDLIIIAGRPSMGKTSFALNIAENVGVDQELPVAVFSMEMGADQLAQRMISSVGRIDAQSSEKVSSTTRTGTTSRRHCIVLKKSPFILTTRRDSRFRNSRAALGGWLIRPDRSVSS